MSPLSGTPTPPYGTPAVSPNPGAAIMPQLQLHCCGPCGSSIVVYGFPMIQVFDANGNMPQWLCSFCKNRGFPLKDCSYFGIRLDYTGDMEEMYCHDCNNVYWEATPMMGVLVPPAPTQQPLFAPNFKFVNKAAVPKKPVCTTCGRELSSTLDAYYGKDPEAAKKCASCR